MDFFCIQFVDGYRISQITLMNGIIIYVHFCLVSYGELTVSIRSETDEPGYPVFPGNLFCRYEWIGFEAFFQNHLAIASASLYTENKCCR